MSLLSRRVRRILVLSLLALAVLYVGPLRTKALSSSSLLQRNGPLRQRIQQKVEEAKATKEREERPPTDVREIAGLNVAIWEPTRRIGSRAAPTLLFSHGFHGCNTQSTFLMQEFADAGYLVFAPNHKDASCGDSAIGARGGGERGGRLGGRRGLGGGGLRPEVSFRDYEAWNDRTYQDRHDDMQRLMEALRRDSQFSRQIDWSRVGLVGHSLGGYTVLGLAGGWPSWRLSGIRAVLALSPVCEPFVLNGNLNGIRIPTMYQGGTRDIGITPSVKKSGGCYAKNASPAIFVEFDGAGHFAWTDLTEPQHGLINHYSLAFLDRYVRGASVNNLTSRESGVTDLRTK
jgi:predicted dienelactone hydrolase